MPQNDVIQSLLFALVVGSCLSVSSVGSTQFRPTMTTNLFIRSRLTFPDFGISRYVSVHTSQVELVVLEAESLASVFRLFSRIFVKPGQMFVELPVWTGNGANEIGPLLLAT